MKPEEKSRRQIDYLLEQAGWKVQDFCKLNLGAALGIAVKEFPQILEISNFPSFYFAYI